MFKVAGTHKSGERYFILGISDEDIARLRQEGPVELDGRDIGIPGKLIVFHGCTDAAMLDEFRAAGVLLPDQTPTED